MTAYGVIEQLACTFQVAAKTPEVEPTYLLRYVASRCRDIHSCHLSKIKKDFIGIYNDVRLCYIYACPECHSHKLGIVLFKHRHRHYQALAPHSTT